MIQKMYLENNKVPRNSRTSSEFDEGVKSKKLDFQFYWRALKKFKWPITFFTSAMAAAAIYYSITSLPVYVANSTLLLESQRANITTIEDLVSSEQESLDYYGTQFAVLKSRGLAERVIRRLELNENVPRTQFTDMVAPSALEQLTASVSQLFGLGNSSTSPTRGLVKGGEVALTDRQQEKEYNEIISQFRKSLSVNPVVKTKLITISYESTDPAFAALTANAVAEEYIASVIEQRKGLKDEASQWMDGRVAELKAELEASEDALLSFKKENGLIDLDGGVGRLNEQELLTTSSELAVVRSELSNATDLFRKIQNFKSSSPELLETLPFVRNDVLVRTVDAEVGQAKRDLGESRNRYGPKHPVMLDAEARLASLRSTLNGHIDRTVATFENDYQLLRQRVATLESNLQQGKDNIQVVGQQKIAMEALERDVTAKRDQYAGLFDRIMETRTTDGLDDANAVVAEAAWVPTKPVKPNKPFIVAVVIFFSLLLSAAVAAIIEFLDRTVTSTDDVERRLNRKLLGVLPLVKQGFLRDRKILPLTPQDVIATSETFSEAVNTCRTALSISNEQDPNNERDVQVILVTSSIPDEGKSTVAMNLANSFGQLERTLLIDCDLRRPSIARALGIPTIAVGLSSLLQKKSSVDDCIKRDVMGSFDCLTSGPIPDQPLEMLASAEFAKVLNYLRQRYDKIIIDSAPTHVVSDALVLSKLSDTVLYVVKPNQTPIKVISSGLSRLTEAHAPVAGVCISQVDISKSTSFSGTEFHGFGIDYQKAGGRYGSYYGYSGRPNKSAKARLKAMQQNEANVA